MTYRARQFLYVAVTLWNAIFDDVLKNSEHVDDFRERLETYNKKILHKKPKHQPTSC